MIRRPIIDLASASATKSHRQRNRLQIESCSNRLCAVYRDCTYWTTCSVTRPPCKVRARISNRSQSNHIAVHIGRILIPVHSANTSTTSINRQRNRLQIESHSSKLITIHLDSTHGTPRPSTAPAKKV